MCDFEKADLELCNMAFNTNVNKYYKFPDWVVALLEDIDRKLSTVARCIGRKDFDSPFDNSGNRWRNDVFEVQAYSWADDEQQQYNFKCGDIEISWYKYLGKDTTINKNCSKGEIIEMYDRCIKSLDDIYTAYINDLEIFNEIRY